MSPGKTDETHQLLTSCLKARNVDIVRHAVLWCVLVRYSAPSDGSPKTVLTYHNYALSNKRKVCTNGLPRREVEALQKPVV